jgi:hypothetical protein
MITLTQKQTHRTATCEHGIDRVSPSPRRVHAAAVERDELTGNRDRLLTACEEACGELARIDAWLRELGERVRLLDGLADPQNGASANPTRSPGTGDRAGVLRGPAIRQRAVEVLLALPERPQAMHYRDWYEAVRAAGFEVAGKDPVAVFLTQISRSPVTRKSTQAGVYELDITAPQRLRDQLQRLHQDLRALIATPGLAADLAAVRGRRAHIHSEIGRVERSLVEAEGLLGPAPGRD